MSAMRDILVEVEQRLEKADPTYRAEEDGYIQKRDLERDEARRREEALTEQRRIDDSVALGEMLLRVEEDLSAEDLLTAAGYDGWMTASIPMEDRGIIKKLVEVEAAHYDYAGVVCEERFVMSPLLKSHLEQDVAREVVG